MTSPQPPDPNTALGAAQTLADALNGLSARLDTVKSDSEERDRSLEVYGKANRHRIWLTYGLLAVDVLLTIAVAFFAVQAGDADRRAESASARAVVANAADSALHAAQISGCQAGNAERAGELALWTYLFHASTPGTPAQQKAVALFMQKVDKTFAPRDCAKAYALTPPKGDGRG